MKFLKGIGTFISNIFSGIFNFFNAITQAIVSVFKKDYPKDSIDFAAILQAILVAAISMLVIFIFDPFGLENLNQIFIAGAIGFFVSLLFSFLASLISKNGWTLFNQVLKQLIVFIAIGIACMIYFQKNINIESLGVFSLISLIPAILYSFFNQNIAESKYSNLAEELNNKLNTLKVNNEITKSVNLQNNNGENLNLLPNQIISIQEKNGSVEVTWQNLFKTQTTSIQNNMKAISDNLTGHSQFIRCNPSTIVNIYAVKNANGNAHGLGLNIAKSNQTINVARNKIQNIQNF